MSNGINLDANAIRKVSFYAASPVESCDRCSAGIKYVSLVTYADGLTQKYGSECIKKILDSAPSLKALYAKNAKLLQKYLNAIEVLTREPEDMPRGSEYYGSGLYFIADAKGKDIFANDHWFFHPLFDVEKNQSGRNHVVRDSIEQYRAKQIAEINDRRGLPWLRNEVVRLEAFLGRILAKVTAEQAAALKQSVEVGA